MRLTKKAKTIIAVVLTAILLIAAAIAAYMLFKPDAQGTKQTFTLYFLDSTGANFSTETRSIEITDDVAADDTKLLSLLVNELIAGPKDSVVNKRAIPAEAELLSLTIGEDKIATVNFSDAFKSKTDLENNFAVCSIVLTLCETGKAEKVAVQVNGKEMIGQGKVPLGALGRADIVNAATPKEADTQKTITLFYPDAKAEKLLTEERALQVDGDTMTAALVLSELIKGTTLPDAVNVIPSSTKVLSCETKEGICYVNLSKDFIAKKPEGSAAETMVVDSIVHTLTNLDGVTKVMFLIEGEKVETYGQMIFDEPFEKEIEAPAAEPLPAAEAETAEE